MTATSHQDAQAARRSGATISNPMPLDLQARERLRDQQQAETRCLATVLTAYRALATEQQRASAAIMKAEQAVAARQSVADAAVVDLIDSCGLAKAAILLDRSATDLARVRRARRSRSSKANDEAVDQGPDVSA